MTAKLKIHTHLLPALRVWTQYIDRAYGNAKFPNFATNEFYRTALKAQVFDCRALPLAFVEDTGISGIEEAEASEEGARLRLPYPNCIFELDDYFIIHAMEVEGDDPDRPETVVQSYWAQWSADTSGGGKFEGADMEVLQWAWSHWLPAAASFFYDEEDGQWHLSSDYDWNYEYVEDNTAKREPVSEEEARELIFPEMAEFCVDEKTHRRFSMTGAMILWGICDLLSQTLVLEQAQRAASPFVNAKRLRKGKAPLSSETRVLTVNTPAVRLASSGYGGGHEHVRLHWRRGHWRVLHRGSEFEAKTWVRRALVGDPALGFVKKDYRLTHVPSLLPEPVPEPEALLH